LRKEYPLKGAHELILTITEWKDRGRPGLLFPAVARSGPKTAPVRPEGLCTSPAILQFNTSRKDAKAQKKESFCTVSLEEPLRVANGVIAVKNRESLHLAALRLCVKSEVKDRDWPPARFPT
jgi:hypothetical protein